MGLGSVDKRKIEITSPIKATGEHEATVRLRDDLVATITLHVTAASSSNQSAVAPSYARGYRFFCVLVNPLLRFMHRKPEKTPNPQAAL